MRWKTTLALLGALGAGAMAQDADLKPPQTQQEMRELREKMNREDKAPKVGQAAPAIKLKSLDGEHSFDLASNMDKKPVILFFGSYT